MSFNAQSHSTVRQVHSVLRRVTALSLLSTLGSKMSNSQEAAAVLFNSEGN